MSLFKILVLLKITQKIRMNLKINYKSQETIMREINASNVIATEIDDQFLS
jgi:hypothetical protein